ncbi:hypothetical protein JG687_00019153 [Phytophthora cactorum]|uniref:Uncharacterized protein n=1 Tax=Phytophthora cactorum TaxID=29920 RepID=A0A8T1TLZ1_9STRA|nr:hypothetical protein PC123_g14898 [Phytophthora cactorum]KAG6942272.1 hypothetical protein JG687_00019153 [Phytophthora cactorum]
MSKSCHFTTFSEHPPVLAAMDKYVIAELRKTLTEQRNIAAGNRAKTTAELEEELANVQVLHYDQLALMQDQVEKLEKDLYDAENYTGELRAQLLRMQEEKQWLHEHTTAVAKAVKLTLLQRVQTRSSSTAVPLDAIYAE